MSNQHPYRVLAAPHGHRVKIDTEIVPLIKLIWQQGWVTFNSCQDNFGYAWVQLFEPDAVAFLNTVRDHIVGEDDGGHLLRDRVLDIDELELRRPRDLDRPPENPNAWYLDRYVTGLGLATISVRFPRAHLGAVVDALQAGVSGEIGPEPR